jgi:hypothetical protein
MDLQPTGATRELTLYYTWAAAAGQRRRVDARVLRHEEATDD